MTRKLPQKLAELPREIAWWLSLPDTAPGDALKTKKK